MSIRDHAKAELAAINFGEEDSRVMLEIIGKFLDQWDSGGAVAVASDVLVRCIKGQPLGPLTGADDEWFIHECRRAMYVSEQAVRQRLQEHEGRPRLRHRCRQQSRADHLPVRPDHTAAADAGVRGRDQRVSPWNTSSCASGSVRAAWRRSKCSAPRPRPRRGARATPARSISARFNGFDIGLGVDAAVIETIVRLRHPEAPEPRPRRPWWRIWR
jgi:hypothetical protein